MENNGRRKEGEKLQDIIRKNRHIKAVYRWSMIEEE
jgi:hypothetical protein